jgi:clan AA aspartic protease (TIGR02281 family)
LGDTVPTGYVSDDDLTYEDDGHYHIKVPIFYEDGDYTNYRADFVFDTGAFITVLTRMTANRLGFLDSHTVKEDVPLTGFMGKGLANIKEIPGMFIGGWFFSGVKVAVPHEETETNILGLNVIDCLKFFVDTEHDKVFYSSLNPQPGIPLPLRCAGIRIISPPGFVKSAASEDPYMDEKN